MVICARPAWMTVTFRFSLLTSRQKLLQYHSARKRQKVSVLSGKNLRSGALRFLERHHMCRSSVDEPMDPAERSGMAYGRQSQFILLRPVAPGADELPGVRFGACRSGSSPLTNLSSMRPRIARVRGLFAPISLPGESGRVFWTRFAGDNASLVQMKEVHSN